MSIKNFSKNQIEFPKPRRNNKMSSNAKIIIGLLLASSILIIVVLISKDYRLVDIPKSETTSSTAKNSIAKAGSRVTLSNDIYAFTSKDNLSKALTFMSAENGSAVNKMLANGEGILIPKGSKVDVISSGTTMKIDYLGYTLYTVMEVVN